jgi:hypothetical protein
LLAHGGSLLGSFDVRARWQAVVYHSARRDGRKAPAKFVVSLNLHRRHLNESQRAMIAARRANMPQGARTDLAAIAAMSQAEAGEIMNVSPDSIQRANKVLESGDDELIAKVDAGDITVNKAVTELKKRENSAKREKIAALDPGSPDKLYNVVVIDPPWPMQKIEREVRPNQTGLDYPVMTLDDISLIEIPAAESCHLWLWTTHKFLPDALTILANWQIQIRLHVRLAQAWRGSTGKPAAVQLRIRAEATRGSGATVVVRGTMHSMVPGYLKRQSREGSAANGLRGQLENDSSEYRAN